MAIFSYSVKLLAVCFFALSSVQAQTPQFPDCFNGPLKSNDVCDTSKSVIDRARGLVAAMTTQEKLNNTGNVTPGVPRLGLPPYNWWQEALHGVASSPGVNFSTNGDFSYATSFPQPILMSAAFDDDLIFDVATAVSTEARAFNNFGRAGLDFWTPNINPFRDPRWGRGQETPGEDPFHLQSYVKSLINGLQGGENPKYKRIVATCKHLVGYDIESWMGNLRYQFDAQISTQDLSEYYMRTFQTCARDANVGAIMCSYNAVNGVPTCASDYFLQTLLRDHWNWTDVDQWVTSDCDAIQNVFNSGGHDHAYASTREQTVADTLIAGTDLNCGTYYQSHLPGALQQSLIKESDLDLALTRLYSSLIKLGFFDPASATPYRSLGWSDVSTPANEKLAYTAAAESIVLLKNDGTLPLASIPSSIAVIGDWANASTQMQGNYHGVAPYLHTPLFAAQQLGVSVNYAGGPSQGDPTTNNWFNALNAAKNSDLVVYIGGLDDGVESEGMDRNLIDWTASQRDLIAQVSAMGKPCIVVQMGTMLDSSQLLANPNISALLWGGYPGQDGGTAIFDIITGKVAPAGRLPVTQYPANYVNQISMTEMSLRPGPNNSVGRTYKWFGSAVLDFGFGMHYTNFTTALSSPPTPTYAISDLTSNCTDQFPDRCPFASFPVQVTNTGKVASDFSTLGFISGQFGPQPYPIKELVAYVRLHSVEPGASQTAMLNLTLGSLARVDESGNTVLYPGDYGLLVDVPTQTVLNFTLTGDSVVLDHWPQPPVRK